MNARAAPRRDAADVELMMRTDVLLPDALPDSREPHGARRGQLSGFYTWMVILITKTRRARTSASSLFQKSYPFFVPFVIFVTS